MIIDDGENPTSLFLKKKIRKLAQLAVINDRNRESHCLHRRFIVKVHN